MTYSRTWSSSYENSPADADMVSEGAQRIRELKTDIRQRMSKNHYWDPSGENEDHGEHTFCTLRKQTSKPTVALNKGHIYTKMVGSYLELFYENSSGTEIQITLGDALGAPSGIPTGTKMVFYQDTAPVGWTIDTSLNDRLLFITKGSAAGGQTGGSVHTSGTWQQPDCTLTIDQIPAHYHTIELGVAYSGTGCATFGGGFAGLLSTTSVGGSQAHNHGSSWRPAACCAIIARKD